MIIVTICKHCGQRYLLPIEAAGSSKNCKICGATIKVAPKSWRRHLREFFGQKRNRNITALITGMVLVCLLLPLAFKLYSEPSPAEIRTNVRTKLFGNDFAPNRGLILHCKSEYDGRTYEIESSLDEQGRFLDLVTHPEDQAVTSSGFDGSHAWKKTRSGVSVQLEHGERARRLFFEWIRNGYWTRPDAPFSLRLNSEVSTDSLIAVDIDMNGMPVFGTMTLDRETWLPHSFTTKIDGEKIEIIFKEFEKFGQFTLATSTESKTDGAFSSRFEVEEVIPVESFTADHFSQPPDTSIVKFDERSYFNVDVKRGHSKKLYVQPRIDGRYVGWFLFDSGAFMTIIYQQHATDLNLPRIGEINGKGVGGETKGTLHQTKTIELGAIRLESFPIQILDPILKSRGELAEGVAGVVGCDLIGQCVIEYEVAAKRISLHNPKNYRLPRGSWQKAIIDGNSPKIRVSCKGNLERRSTFLVDTGASGVIFAPHIGGDLFWDERGTLRPIGGFGGTTGVLSGRLDWIELGGRRIPNVPVDFGIDPRSGLADSFCDGILGIEVFSPFMIVFDIPNRRIAFLESL